MIPCVIFDIDGVLADGEHRLHLIHRPDPDWEEFFRAAQDDPPFPAMVRLNHAVAATTGIALITGRPERIRTLTERWLRRHGIEWNVLLMRGNDDRRPDTITKREAHDRLGIYGYRPFLAIEDRPSVVAMWRMLGLSCLAADASLWDATQPAFDGAKP
jgi:hypothetical protein